MCTCPSQQVSSDSGSAGAAGSRQDELPPALPGASLCNLSPLMGGKGEAPVISDVSALLAREH